MKIEYFLKKEITELYITNSLRSFGLSLISVFLPIFFIKQGYSLLDIVLYLTINIFIGILLSYTALKFIAKKGIKHSILLSLPFLITFFIMLHNIDELILKMGKYGYLIILSVLSAISVKFYYMGFHVDFAKFTQIKDSAKQLSVITALSILVSVIGPIAGALIISYYSFNTLFIIIILILLSSATPLFFTKDSPEPTGFNIENAFTKDKMKENWPFYAEGIRDYASRIYWPLLLYFLLVSIGQIGALFTISNGILVLFTIYIGKITKESNKKKILKTGTIIHAISLGSRVFLKTMSLITIVQGVGAAAFTMIHMPFYSIFYNNSKKRGISKIIFLREIYLHLGRATSLFTLCISIFLLKDIRAALMIAIIVGAIATLFMSKLEEVSEPSEVFSKT
jgi:hypothetical protein